MKRVMYNVLLLALALIALAAVVSFLSYSVRDGNRQRERREAVTKQALASEYEIIEAWRTSDQLTPESTYVLDGGPGKARLTVVSTRVWLVGDHLRSVKQAAGRPTDLANIVMADGQQTGLYGYRFEQVTTPIGAEKAP